MTKEIHGATKLYIERISENETMTPLAKIQAISTIFDVVLDLDPNLISSDEAIDIGNYGLELRRREGEKK